METLQIKRKKAQKAYKGASPELKKMLEDLFEKEDLQPGDITDEIKTFEDACDALNINPAKVFSDSDTEDEIAYKKIKIIARALNEGWTPDWSNGSQWKYYPYFKKNASGVGFSYHVFGHVFSDSHVGSRLVFKSAALAEYAGKQFLAEYNKFIDL